MPTFLWASANRMTIHPLNLAINLTINHKISALTT
jgi:hypothetical protein